MPQLRSLADSLRPAPWRLNLLHGTDTHRLIVVTKGQGRVLHDGQRRGVGPGQLIYIPAGQCFAMEMGAQASGHVLNVPTRLDQDWPTDPLLARHHDLQDHDTLVTFLDIIAREQGAQNLHGSEAAEASTKLVSVWLRRQFAAQSPPRKPTAAQKLLRLFFAELEVRYRSGASMAQYAHSLNVTPTHLSRVCKSTLGLSAADLIMERILHAARCMLEDTDRPAKEIAADLGFGSAAYFSRFILNKTGATPKALRAGAKPAR